jgi:hypothetical protein
MLSAELRRAVKHAGFQERRFDDARARIGAKSKLIGYGGRWISFLPARPYPYFRTRGIESEDYAISVCRFCKNGMATVEESGEVDPRLLAAIRQYRTPAGMLLERHRQHLEAIGAAELERRLKAAESLPPAPDAPQSPRGAFEASHYAIYSKQG